MRRSGWIPSIVPSGSDQTVYIVLDDFGPKGRAFRETDVERADLESLIADLMTGEFSKPISVVAFNTAERRSQDASADVAHEIRRRCEVHGVDVPAGLQDFVKRHEGIRAVTSRPF